MPATTAQPRHQNPDPAIPRGHQLAIANRVVNRLLRGLRWQGERGFAILTGGWKTLRHTTASPRRLRPSGPRGALRESLRRWHPSSLRAGAESAAGLRDHAGCGGADVEQQVPAARYDVGEVPDDVWPIEQVLLVLELVVVERQPDSPG